MAKKNISATFEHACIDLNDMTITECTKDETRVYSIMDILREWESVDDITLSIKQSALIPVPESGEE